MIIRAKNKFTWEIGKLNKRFQLFMDRITRGIFLYKPKKYSDPARKLAIEVSAWKGLEKILEDIIGQSGIDRERCLEFGVEFGYSTVALSNYFKQVTGVDIFTGDPHAGYHGDIYDKVKNDLSPYENISLIKSDYRDYIKGNDQMYDLIHVDIIHTYEATFDCGIWSALHSKCTIFHDTESFPEVKRAVSDIAKKTGKTFYNYPHYDGLGILY